MIWMASKVRGDRCLAINDNSDVWMFKADPDPNFGFVASIVRRDVHAHFDGRYQPAHECDEATINGILDSLMDDPFR